jgi:hypothetical protein
LKISSLKFQISDLGHWGPSIALTLLLFAGCSKSLESSLEGIVTLDGKLLSAGTVCLYPVAGGPAAYGGIHTDGHYAISTGSQRGLPLGKYTVTVVATAPPPDATMNTPGALLTPERYGDPDRSGLSCDVHPGSNRYDISLSSK